MARISDVHSIVVAANTPNLTAHTYNEIYGGTGGCSIVINGTLMQIAESSNVAIWIRTVSGGTGCYLLGENQNVTQGSPTP